MPDPAPRGGPAGVDLEPYLERIGYAGSCAPTLDALKELQLAHAQSIPFENLSPLLGEPVPLDLDALQDKLVRRRRGGYCFEHNLLFMRALERLGFRVAGLAARVLWGTPERGPRPRSHMLLLIGIDGRRLIADVGFGGPTPTAPLELDTEAEQATPHEAFRLRRAGGDYVLEIRIAGDWQAVYSFDLQAQTPPDYEAMNWYVSTHPQSYFVTGLSAARAAPGRRYALRDAGFAVHHLTGKTERRTLASVDELKQTLETVFGIALPASPALDGRLGRLIRGDESC